MNRTASANATRGRNLFPVRCRSAIVLLLDYLSPVGRGCCMGETRKGRGSWGGGATIPNLPPQARPVGHLLGVADFPVPAVHAAAREEHTMSAQRWLLVVLGVAAVQTRSVATEKPSERPPFPAGWEQVSQREEISPACSFDPSGGPKGGGAFVITASDCVGQHGWVQKTFPVTGGKFYRFQAMRRTDGVAVPRRSAVARIVWQDSKGKPVRADVPAGRETEAGPIPLAEPEHPLDAGTDPQGWTKVTGHYRAPTSAARAVVELHLQWAPRGRVQWSEAVFGQTPPPPSRKVRLAAVHHVPSGKSPRANR